MIGLCLLLLVIKRNDLLLLEEPLDLVGTGDGHVHLLGLLVPLLLHAHELLALRVLSLGLELVVAELVELLLRTVEGGGLSSWLATGVEEHFLLLLLRSGRVPGWSALLLGVLTHLFVLVDDLQLAFHEAFQFSALARGQGVDVDLYFVLGDVLSFGNDLAHNS